MIYGLSTANHDRGLTILAAMSIRLLSLCEIHYYSELRYRES